MNSSNPNTALADDAAVARATSPPAAAAGANAVAAANPELLGTAVDENGAEREGGHRPPLQQQEQRQKSTTPTWQRTLARLGQALAVPVAVLLFWQLISDPRVKEWPVVKDHPALAERLPNAQILPPPTRVFAKWLEYARPTAPYDPAKGESWLRWAISGELWGDAFSSLQRVLIGFAIGAGLALPLGLFMGASDSVYKFCNPLLQVLRPIPPIAYIPLSILWFGLGNKPAWFLISLGAFFPVLVNTIAGVRNVDGIFLRAARNLGAKGFTMFWRVILPAATPYILTGVRVGIGVAFIVVIVAEMIAVNSGLGYRILEAREFFWSDKIIAGMISIGLLGLGLDTLMDRLNSHLLRWHRGADAGANN